jgi:hypothetical protein
MVDVTTPEPLPDGDPTGITGRAAFTVVALAAEGVNMLKYTGNEALEVAESTTTTTLEVLDGLADDFAGPLASLAKAPTVVLRAAYQAGAESGRRLLAVA